MRLFLPTKPGLARLLKDERKLVHEVEAQTKTKIKESDDALEIEGEAEDEWVAEQVLKALVMGFPPEKAFKLLKDEWFLEEIDLEAAMRGSKRGTERQKGRIIGTGGKAKKTLEELSGAYLSISGDKVALLGRFEDLQGAREAILQLLEGKPHASVYAGLETRNRNERIAQFAKR
jgi:ribosomal RNA assembly protein